MRELEILKHIYAKNAELGENVRIGPGDDMGAVDVHGGAVLVAVDQLADGVHFDLATTPVVKVGRKAINRCLSDVAAMAAQPLAIVVAAALPSGFGEGQAEELVDAMSAAAGVFSCPVVGGDVLVWDRPMLLTVTAMATAGGVGPITRSGARVGDAICVTGDLGGSMETIDGVTHHLDFEPRLSVARGLGRLLGDSMHGMIDLSDGLASDIARVCELAEGERIGAELWADRLPVSAAAERAAECDGRAGWEHAIGDGEDYELCFTVAEEAVGGLPSEFEGVKVSRVGRIVSWIDGAPRVGVRVGDGRVVSGDRLGWEHSG